MSFIEYLKSTKSELKHVNWPTQKQTIAYTVIVIILAIGTGAYLGVLDFGFSNLLKTFIF